MSALNTEQTCQNPEVWGAIRVCSFTSLLAFSFESAKTLRVLGSSQFLHSLHHFCFGHDLS